MSWQSAKEAEDLDMAIALSLADAEETPGAWSGGGRGGGGGGIGGGSRVGTGSKRQEEEDAALARALQEELNRDQGGAGNVNNSRSSSSSGSNKNSSNNRGAPAMSGNHSSSSSNIGLLPRYKSGCAFCGGSLVGEYASAMNMSFHKACFRCSACQRPLEGAFVPRDGLFLHAECAEELFLPKCTVCRGGLRGRYFTHSFFEDETYCLAHGEYPRYCYSCHRKEPLASTGKPGFSELPDKRLICDTCVKTVVIDSAEAQPLYQRAVDFFQYSLGLPIPEGMRQVPILAVDAFALNEQTPRGRFSSHQGPTCRGLTLCEASEVRHMSGGSLVWDPRRGHFVEQGAGTVMRVQKIRSVTAVLVLYGLPRDLAASILAHEAMHVWIKLSENFPFHLPPRVEEGLCQLVADKFLAYLELEEGSSRPRGPKEDAASAQETALHLSYFRHQIASDRSDIYGGGFREASRCSGALGLEILLEHVRQHQSFPAT